MRKILMMTSVAAAAGLAAAANGAVSYTSQVRSITTNGGFVPPTSFTETAPDFGPFVASRTDFFGNPDGEPPSRGQAAQNSTLGVDGIRITGSVSGTDNYGSAGVGSGFGSSQFDVTFTIDQATPFSFFGTHTGSFNFGPGGISDWTIRLSEVGGSVLFARTVALLFQGAPDQTPGTFSRSGVLGPGSYRLEANFTEGWTGFGTGSGSGLFDLTLLAPAPGTAGGVLILGAAALRRRRRTIAAG